MLRLFGHRDGVEAAVQGKELMAKVELVDLPEDFLNDDIIEVC
jgi:hypothetical protein